jgi:hypothetical protein
MGDSELIARSKTHASSLRSEPKGNGTSGIPVLKVTVRVEPSPSRAVRVMGFSVVELYGKVQSSIAWAILMTSLPSLPVLRSSRSWPKRNACFPFATRFSAIRSCTTNFGKASGSARLASIVRGEVREDRGQDGGEVLRAADAEVACEVRALHGVEQFVVEGEDAAGVGEGDFAGFGEGEAAATFAEERGGEIVLEALHLQTDGGGRSAETLCGLRETSEVMRDGEGAQGVEIEVGEG